MKSKTLNGLHVWKQFEDLLITRLRLNVTERALYSHLLCHSCLDGKQRRRFSIRKLARDASLSAWTTRRAVRSLAAKGALHLAERSKAGHVVKLRLPEEILSARARKNAAAGVTSLLAMNSLEAMDFLHSQSFRQAIHKREGGFCFYCLRRLTQPKRCLDHVIPLAQMGGNSYRNLVSACAECNSQKRERRAEDFVRWLYREGHLTAAEFRGRLRGLKALAAGRLRPVVPGPAE
jgi:predicted DNA-binding transcriptional regulator